MQVTWLLVKIRMCGPLEYVQPIGHLRVRRLVPSAEIQNTKSILNPNPRFGFRFNPTSTSGVRVLGPPLSGVQSAIAVITADGEPNSQMISSTCQFGVYHGDAFQLCLVMSQCC